MGQLSMQAEVTSPRETLHASQYGLPLGRARVHALEMAAVGKRQQLDGVASRAGGRRIVRADLIGDAVVRGTMDEYLAHAQREQRAGRAGDVAVSELICGAAHQRRP